MIQFLHFLSYLHCHYQFLHYTMQSFFQRCSQNFCECHAVCMLEVAAISIITEEKGQGGTEGKNERRNTTCGLASCFQEAPLSPKPDRRWAAQGGKRQRPAHCPRLARCPGGPRGQCVVKVFPPSNPRIRGGMRFWHFTRKWPKDAFRPIFGRRIIRCSDKLGAEGATWFHK